MYNKNFNKKQKTDFKVINKKNSVIFVFDSPSTSIPNVTCVLAKITLKDLKKLVFEAEKRAVYFNKLDKKRKKDKLRAITPTFLSHPSPDLTFLVKYK